ncbi:putative membrane insertase YidC/ALB3/OXA1/COX18 [Septoria linicola]|nr:putative membrane insertase YidC/ALB3/OXA1/COX18 [Septoria linicola]
MASLLGSKLSRAQFLQLPPAIRSSIYASSLSRRTFSSSAPRKSAITDIAIAGPAALLSAIHGLGVPWYAAIPATAVLVRCTIGYYLGALPARKRAIVRTYLSPLTGNSARQKANEAMQRSVNEDERAGRSVHALGLSIRQIAYKLWFNVAESHRIGKKFKAPLFAPASFLNFGLLIVFAEAIRVKCGHREGMLSMLVRPFESLMSNFTNEATLSPEDVIAERMEAAQAAADAQAELYASGTGDVVVDAKLLDPAYHFELMDKAAKTYSDSLDPSMLVEGVSWAQNLAIPDSTFMLPAMLSATILVGVFTRNGPAQAVVKPKQRKIETPVDVSAESKNATSPPLPAQEDLSSRTKEINNAFALADKMREDSKAQRKTDVVFQKFTLGQKIRIWMAGLFFIVGSGLPTGLLLYMIPSIVVGQLHARWLDVKHPIPTTIQPCRRPMRIKVKKEFGDA